MENDYVGPLKGSVWDPTSFGLTGNPVSSFKRVHEVWNRLL